MKFGVLFRIQDPPRREHIGRRMRETIRASQVAEEAGFDGVFLPEHHMMDDAYLPSPFPLLGALAATTERPLPAMLASSFGVSVSSALCVAAAAVLTMGSF